MGVSWLEWNSVRKAVEVAAEIDERIEQLAERLHPSVKAQVLDGLPAGVLITQNTLSVSIGGHCVWDDQNDPEEELDVDHCLGALAFEIHPARRLLEAIEREAEQQKSEADG